MILAIDFFVDILYQDVDISIYSFCLHLKIINGLTLSSAFSVSIEMII